MKVLIAGLKRNIQVQRLSEEGEKKGHKVDGCLATDLVIKAQQGKFDVSVLGLDIKSYDLIYLMVSKRRWEWYVAADYLHKAKNTVIVNQKVVDPSYQYFLTPVADYLKQIEADLPFPKSAIVFSKKTAKEAAGEFEFPIVVKASKGRQGRGVYKAESANELLGLVDTHKEDAPFVLREFIPNNGDIRVFTVGYKAIGAMKREVVSADEFRSNISLGGKGSVYDLSSNPKVAEIAEKVSKVSRTEIAGVDIMLHKNTGDPYILEINPGPQFEGLEKYTGVNAAGEIISYFESLQT